MSPSGAAVAAALLGRLVLPGALVLVLAGCGPVSFPAADPSTSTRASSARPSSARPSSRPTSAAGSAAAALDTLQVVSRRSVPGYQRSAFGQRWADVDRNGCDTRNDVLRRDLTGVVLDPRTRGCVVRSGRLVDPYTGRVVDFVRGPSTSPLVEIDHVVALAAAWRTGASGWSARRREEFANDPLELVATTRAANQSKGGADAAGWLPSSTAARCALVARQVAVKLRYGLAVTPAERTAIRRVLDACPEQRLPG